MFSCLSDNFKVWFPASVPVNFETQVVGISVHLLTPNTVNKSNWLCCHSQHLIQRYTEVSSLPHVQYKFAVYMELMFYRSPPFKLTTSICLHCLVVHAMVLCLGTPANCLRQLCILGMLHCLSENFWIWFPPSVSALLTSAQWNLSSLPFCLTRTWI